MGTGTVETSVVFFVVMCFGWTYVLTVIVSIVVVNEDEYLIIIHHQSYCLARIHCRCVGSNVRRLTSLVMTAYRFRSSV